MAFSFNLYNMTFLSKTQEECSEEYNEGQKIGFKQIRKVGQDQLN